MKKIRTCFGALAVLLMSAAVASAQTKSGVDKLYILNCGEGVAGDISPGHSGRFYAHHHHACRGRHTSQLDWFATVRGRLGYAWDHFLLYATGGVAFRNSDNGDDFGGFGSFGGFGLPSGGSLSMPS